MAVNLEIDGYGAFANPESIDGAVFELNQAIATRDQDGKELAGMATLYVGAEMMKEDGREWLEYKRSLIEKFSALVSPIGEIRITPVE